MFNIIHRRGIPDVKPILVGTDRLAGYFKIEVIGPDGRRRLAAPWQPNLITNSGMDQAGWGNKGGFVGQNLRWIYWCSLGTGSTTPAFTDTALATFRAQAGTISNTYGATASAPYYKWQKNVYRFGQGVADGIITEIGAGMQNGSGDLSTRALILDPSGNPTSIVITPDEQVDITYEFRAYIPDLTTTDLQFTIDGILYDVKSLAAETAAGGGGFHYGGGLGGTYIYKGTSLPNIGTYLTAPLDSMGNATTVLAGYGIGNYYRDASITMGYTSYYWGTKGITAFLLHSHFSNWQLSFTQNLDPTWGIPHDNTNELVVNFRHSWARYTPP